MRPYARERTRGHPCPVRAREVGHALPKPSSPLPPHRASITNGSSEKTLDPTAAGLPNLYLDHLSAFRNGVRAMKGTKRDGC